MNFRISHIARRTAGFTMVEIAICLAIIGLALVSIIGVLPIGMHVQRDNREETVIDQDASVLMESIRNGVQGGTDLTNYVFAITNYWTKFNANGVSDSSGANGYSYAGSYVYGSSSAFALTNNGNIIGLLSTPEYQLIDRLTPTNNVMNGGYSNHVEAYVHALSGPAMEKPPQDNQLLVGDSFTYLVVPANSPPAVDTNIFGLNASQQMYAQQLSANLHELRLSFYWPVEPNGSVGRGRQTQRTLIAGTIFVVDNNPFGQPLYYFGSQSFTTVTNYP